MSQIRGFILKILLSGRLYLLVRIALAVLFIYAGTLKLMSPKAFARVISQYDLLPEPLLPVVAIGLPIIEVLAGIALIFDLRSGLHGVSGLILLFVFVLGYGVYNEMDVDCGCFGPEELANQRSLVRALYRDLALLGGAAFLYLSRLSRGRRFLNESTQNITK